MNKLWTVSRSHRSVSGHTAFSVVLLLNTETALVTRKQQKQLQLNLAIYVQVSWFSFTLLNMVRNSDIIPERSLLPAPALPPLFLHIIVLSGGCGGYSGTVQCWCCRGPLPSYISWLPHWRRWDHNSCLTWLEYEGLVAAVEDARESVGAFEVEKGGNREDQEQADQQCSQKKRRCHTGPSNFRNDSSYSCVIFPLHCIVVGADCYVLQIHSCWVTEYANGVAVLKDTQEASWFTVSVVWTWIVHSLFLAAALKWVLMQGLCYRCLGSDKNHSRSQDQKEWQSHIQTQPNTRLWPDQTLSRGLPNVRLRPPQRYYQTVTYIFGSFVINTPLQSSHR